MLITRFYTRVSRNKLTSDDPSYAEGLSAEE